MPVVKASRAAKLPASSDVKLDVVSRPPATLEAGGAFVFLAAESGELLSDLTHLPKGAVDAARRLLRDGTIRGKAGEAATSVSDGTRVVVVGVGEASRHPRPSDAVRAAAVATARQARRMTLDRVVLIPPADRDSDAPYVEAAVTGFLLGAFEFREWRGSGARKDEPSLGRCRLMIVSQSKQAPAAGERGEIIGLAQNYARTVANRPGNDINPPSLAREADRLAKTVGLNLRVIDEKQARKLGMGGLVAVGQGSGSPPRMIVLEYNPPGSPTRGRGAKRATKKKAAGDKPLMVIGKAITFDTGGISLKPPQGMGSMVFDKCGGMAVLGTMAAVALLRVKRPVVGIIAAAENMPGPDAYRPGDIVRMYNGVTVEVISTDAEGRMVLADALAWGIEQYQPRAVVDLATLTGACVVALGYSRAGGWCNDEALFDSLKAASEQAGEKIWRMPLGDEYREMLRASVGADVVNSPGRWGGCNTAAEFLHHFVPGNLDGGKEVPWCHMDIAGVADAEKETALYSKGATGFGVRTMVEWITGQ